MEAKDLVNEVRSDFEERRNRRRSQESKWKLNIKFMSGKQNVFLDPGGDVVDERREKEVYNHIAPIIETRLAKFARVNCAVNVRPAGADEKDVNAAKLSAKIIDATLTDNNFTALSGEANYWAELTGTAFYKVVWDDAAGVKIAVCPPQEIYPDDLEAPSVSALRSIIHAKIYPVEAIYELWGVEVEPEDVDVYGLEGDPVKVAKDENRSGYALVLERYSAPSKDEPNGRLTIVAGDKLVYDGELPYVNAAGDKRGFPFIRQCALNSPGSFFGTSLIERLIPVQRAYNAVKNRKHEFMARLSGGVYAVEDGAVDVESLEEEGFYPGRVVVYRQGSQPPVPMNPGSVPAEFRDEEDRLLEEFRRISGVSNILNISGTGLTSMSGYALSLLLEQENARMTVTTESIRAAVKEVSRHILRLYKQFADKKRLVVISGDSGAVEAVAFIGSELGGDDVVQETDSEMVESPATRKNMVLELMRYGLLSDENGMISNRNRAKIVEMLGFGNWEAAKNSEEVHLKKAERENAEMAAGNAVEPSELDAHDLHISEHSAYAAGADVTAETLAAIEKHVRRHKILLSLSQQAAEMAKIQ